MRNHEYIPILQLPKSQKCYYGLQKAKIEYFNQVCHFGSFLRNLAKYVHILNRGKKNKKPEIT